MIIVFAIFVPFVVRIKKPPVGGFRFTLDYSEPYSDSASSARYSATPSGLAFMPLAPWFQPAGQTSPCCSWNCRASTMRSISSMLRPNGRSYFKALAEQKGIPYQSLINLYLRDCAERNRDLKIKWG